MLGERQVGFTLLELMFVVAIIGILTSISLPIYQDLMSKTQMHTAYHSLSTLKVPANIKLNRGDEVEHISDLAWISGSTYLFQNDPVVTTDSTSGALSIEAVLDGKVNPGAKSAKIVLSRDVFGTWGCSVIKTENSAWKDSFSPKACTVM